jgi:acetylornithine deacetylase/succinyl-diaminopimelate desuccinylase-like protein
VPDEEAGGGTGTLACVDVDRAAGRRPDLVVVCEPTRLAVCTAQVGSRVMRFTVHGVPAHANSKHLGCSATELAMDMARRLQTSTLSGRERREHPLLPPASVNIGRIEGGLGATSVAARCVMETCTTYHPDDEADLAGTIDDVIAGWRSDHADEQCSVDVELLHDVVPYETDVTDPLVAMLGRHATASGSFAPQGFPAGSDGRLFDRLLQCPTVIFGPGDIEHIHKPDEHVDLAEVDRFADIVAALLLEASRRTIERNA